jgi:hypothetical protein
MRARLSSAILGAVGALLLLVFWLSTGWPKQADALLRPYGLFVWFGVLGAAIVLPTIAALRDSKWWFLLTAASSLTAMRFFLGVMS